jgi:hypothetical protein
VCVSAPFIRSRYCRRSRATSASLSVRAGGDDFVLARRRIPKSVSLAA